jgi:aspartate-semialdehyde dehydrogenase
MALFKAFFLVVILGLNVAEALNVVIAGGTGQIGKKIIPLLSEHDITVLTRNSFLASAPNKVTEAFGYLGESYLKRNPHAKLRDWDGGDLLDIVGKDWVGWQEDALTSADVIVHLVGGYTDQRTKAYERLVRESFRANPSALHVTVNPTEDDIPILTPGMVTLKTKRIKECEDMVKKNIANSKCLRLQVYQMDKTCSKICEAIESWEKASPNCQMQYPTK